MHEQPRIESRQGRDSPYDAARAASEDGTQPGRQELHSLMLQALRMRPATCVGVLPCNPVSGLQDRPLGVEGPAHRKARSDVTSGLLRSMGRAYTLLTHRHPYDGNPANPCKKTAFYTQRRW